MPARDSRVAKLAAYAKANQAVDISPWIGHEDQLALSAIREVEAAGLLVIDPDDEATVERATQVIKDMPDWSSDDSTIIAQATARAVLAALQATP